MNRGIPVIVLLALLGFPPGLHNRGLPQDISPADNSSLGIAIDSDQVIDPSRAEEDDFLYDPEIISRKLFQKKLPALSGRNKVIWSFRTADSDLFQ